MIQIGILITAAAAAFGICASVMYQIMKPQLQIEKRIEDVHAERVEETPKQAKKSPRKKRKETAGVATRTRKELDKLENELYDVGIRIPVTRFLAMWVAITIAVPALLIVVVESTVIAVVVAAVCAMGPIMYLRIRKNKRKAKLEGQLVDAIGVLTNALKAGHSFQSAMNSIAVEMETPISEEFGRVFRETQHGIALNESMDRMVERVGSDDLEMLCTAVNIQREVGGNLAEVLNNVAETIQARISLKAEIKTRTASGRMSGYIIGALPVLLLVAMYVMNPSYCSMFITTKIGNIMLIISGVMEVVGFMVIRKITDIKY